MSHGRGREQMRVGQQERWCVSPLYLKKKGYLRGNQVIYKKRRCWLSAMAKFINTSQCHAILLRIHVFKKTCSLGKKVRFNLSE